MSLPSPGKGSKKRVATPISSTGLRRSSRLLAIRDGHKGDSLTQPDRNQGIGKPRGKSVKKLKQVAKEVGLLFKDDGLQDSDLVEGATVDNASEIPADCPVPLLQKMAVDLCGASLQEVYQIDQVKNSASNGLDDSD